MSKRNRNIILGAGIVFGLILFGVFASAFTGNEASDEAEMQFYDELVYEFSDMVIIEFDDDKNRYTIQPHDFYFEEIYQEASLGDSWYIDEWEYTKLDMIKYSNQAKERLGEGYEIMLPHYQRTETPYIIASDGEITYDILAEKLER